jgi:hypothetical protein
VGREERVEGGEIRAMGFEIGAEGGNSKLSLAVGFNRLQY